MSAASVAVIYAYRRKTARAFAKIFWFFCRRPRISRATRRWMRCGKPAGLRRAKGALRWGRH